MILFLYGEDSFRSSQKMKELKDRFLATDLSASGLSVFDYEENCKQRLIDVLSTPNLLAPKRLVIVKNMLSSGSDSEKDEALAFLAQHEKQLQEDKDLIAVFWEKGQPKKNGKLYKALEKIAKTQNFESLSGLKLAQWAVKRIKETDPKSGISKSALEKLILYAGKDLAALDAEIRKLVDFASGRIIKEEDVERLVKADMDVNIFNTIDALANNNKKEAVRLLQDHLKKGEDLFYIFSMFVYQFRNLLKVADLVEQFHGNDFQIAKASGLHPFVVKKSLAQLRNFSLDRLKDIYRKLQDYDTRIKTGKIDIKLALDKFIVEL